MQETVHKFTQFEDSRLQVKELLDNEIAQKKHEAVQLGKSFDDN